MRVLKYIVIILLASSGHSILAMQALIAKQNAVTKSEVQPSADEVLTNIKGQITRLNDAYTNYRKAFEANKGKDDPLAGTATPLANYYTAVNTALEGMSKAVQWYPKNSEIQTLQNELYNTIINNVFDYWDGYLRMSANQWPQDWTADEVKKTLKENVQNFITYPVLHYKNNFGKVGIYTNTLANLEIAATKNQWKKLLKLAQAKASEKNIALNLSESTKKSFDEFVKEETSAPSALPIKEEPTQTPPAEPKSASAPLSPEERYDAQKKVDADFKAWHDAYLQNVNYRLPAGGSRKPVVIWFIDEVKEKFKTEKNIHIKKMYYERLLKEYKALSDKWGLQDDMKALAKEAGEEWK